MKKLVFTLAMCLMAWVAQAQTEKTINLTTAGTLSSLLTTTEKTTITNLTVTGNIDARDVKCMRDEMTVLANLNLKDATIVAYSGINGTMLNTSKSYPKNEIPFSAFNNNSTYLGKSTLSTIILPLSITSIGQSAFYGCIGLKGNLKIPSLVTIIRPLAFAGCSDLKTFISLNPTPPNMFDASSFNGISATVYVPNSTAIIAYKAATGWSTFNIVEAGISTSTPTINGLIYAPNAGPSDIKSFNVSEGLITSDITITAPANFEISTKSGAAFIPTNVITVSPVDDMVADTTFYVRLKTGLSVNTYNGNITLEATGFTTKNIALNGEVRNTPEVINVTTAGTLSSMLSGSEKAAITKLTITGNIDARDFVTIRDAMPMLSVLDLSGASIMAYNGNAGTNQWSTSYPANEMPEYAFWKYLDYSYFSPLKTIKLPTNLISLGGSVFRNCKNLKTIICLISTPPTVGGMCFEGVSSPVVYVPVGTVPTYKAINSWNLFNMTYPNQITNISEPGITITNPSISGLIYAPNAGPSEIKPFKVSGGLLTSDIIITAPANFEISTKSGAAFIPTNVITVSPVDGMVADTTFYVRLKAGLGLNTYTGNITIESSGFTTQNITLNGIVRTIPEVINVVTAGTLSSLLATNEKTSITKLIVTGNIDARDIFCMRDQLTILTNLDLSSTSISGYTSSERDVYGNLISYSANEMPSYSFGNYSTGKITLISIKLPNSLTAIRFRTFDNCSGLKGSFIIPNKVTTIDTESFAGCSGITSIISLNPNPPTISDAFWTFYRVNPTVVYVPTGSVPSYKAASGWSSFNIAEYKLKTSTQAVTNIKLNSVKVNGTLDVITDSPVSAHGFCWNTTGSPTIADSKVDNGATTTEGIYSNTIDNLTEATTCYVRAYATDGTSGTVYGDEVSFTTAEIPATSNLSGNFFNSQYWPKSKSPYTITGNMNLAIGTTLTIEPGVVVNFAGNYELLTMGNIIANGITNDSITFNANGNTCTFMNFKNTKLSDSELSFLKLLGHKIMPPLYAKALKTEGTCTDSLTINNSRIEIAEIKSTNTVTIKNSTINDLSAGTSSYILDDSKIRTAQFGDNMAYYGYNKYITVRNSMATGLSFNGDSYNSRVNILNSAIKSSNFGRSSTNVKKSTLSKCNFSANSWESPTITLDSTILSYTSFSIGTGSSTISNCIFINDTTQQVKLKGTTTKSQFIGENKLGGVGIDEVSGTMTNCLISSSKIGALAATLTINNSNFMNNTQYNIKNVGANTIDAKNNFWGIGNTTSVAVKNTIYDYYKDLALGKVLFDNQLSTPNIDCPISSPQNVQKAAVSGGISYTWNANPESDVKGYKLYYGSFDGFKFANSVDVGNVTNYTLSNTTLTDIVLVTAHDQQADGKNDMLEGHESWYSAYTFPEKAGTITGPTIVCQGESAKVYTVPAIANTTSYIWTLPSGTTETSLTNSISVNFSSSATSGNITVKGKNDFGEGIVSTLPITVNSVPTSSGLGVIMGNSTVNQGQNSVTYNAYYSNATSYKWTLPDGASGTSTTSSITVNYSTSAISGNITVTPHNDCGDGITTSLAITVRPLPAAAGVITGSTSVCLGQSAVIYTVPAIQNATSYNWTLPNGASGTSSTNSITVNYSSWATSGNITVKGRNSIGSGISSSLAITVIQPVGYVGVEGISGLRTVCLGQKAVLYTVQPIENATSYIWTLPSGAIGTSTTNSISVDFVPSSVSGNISVRGKNSCGEGMDASYAITVIQPVADAGTITGASTVCQGQNAVNYTVSTIANATSYEWTLPTGVTGTSTTNSITVNYTKTALSGNITVKGINTCGNGIVSTLAVTVNPLPIAAGTITGASTVCQGQNTVVYTVPNIENATSYVWTLPTGATGTSTTNSITVNYAKTAISGNITVKGNNACGDGVAATMAVTVNPLPLSAGTISGAITVCQGENTVVYSVPAITNATRYNWTLPTGATGTSTTNSISVNYSKTAISGNITVKGNNDCGDGVVSTVAIIVKPLVADAGTITGASTVCQGQNAVNYTVPTIANATSYEWTLPTGVTGTSTANSITVNYSTLAVSGAITVKGKNSCGSGNPSSLSISVNPLPASAGTITGKTELCQGEVSVAYTVPAIANATAYKWTLPSGASGTSTTNTIVVDYSNSAVTGNISVKGQNDCGYGIASTLAITINQLPIITATDKTVTCGGSVSLDAATNYTGNGVLEYAWTPTTGLNDAAIANPTATLFADQAYTLTVKTPSGCTTSSNVKVKIIPMSKPNICMVGVHSSNKNMIIWEKPLSNGIESFNLYKETNVTDVYEKISNIAYSGSSVYVDNTSSPDVQSNHYKLSILDKAGLESEYSNSHKTMHLSINKGLNTTWNLNWEKYEGFTVSTYNVYRGNSKSNLELIGSTSGNSTQYSDINAPAGDVYYQLEVVNPNPCTASIMLNAAQKVKSSENSVVELYSSSRSNIASNLSSGISNGNANHTIKVSPNPVRNELRLEYDGETRFEIVNLVGQVIYNGVLVKTALIETNHLFAGVYLIRFIQGNSTCTVKFIKE